jgi:hypothetical protein
MVGYFLDLDVGLEINLLDVVLQAECELLVDVLFELDLGGLKNTIAN